MKKIFIVIAILIIGFAVWASRPAFGPVSTSAPSSPSPAASNTTGLPLTLPSGFSISTFAKGLGSPRVLAWDARGRLLVSIPSQGKVMAISDTTVMVVEGLNLPHGLAFKDGKLYIAETDAVAVYDYDQSTAKATNRKKIVDVPGGGNHFSRTIGFGPDRKLYISIGSSCNACVEKDARRASIMVYDGELKPFATGLRNSVFFTWRNGDMWATDMGRDLIGDNIPPEEVNIVSGGKNYGWPYCYGKQIHDDNFDRSGKFVDFCKTVEPPQIEYQAHSAPLGLAFIPASWGREYAGDLLVAYHGSWNRTEPTGYKIVRFDLDRNNEASDFITGWLQGDSAVGRPVDLLFDDKGALYISDDKAGVIYRVTKV